MGYDYFRPRLKKAFSAKADLSNEEDIRKGIAQGEYVKKGPFKAKLLTLTVIERLRIFCADKNSSTEIEAL